MIALGLVGMALATDRWAGHEPDVIAERTLPAAPEVVYEKLVDLMALKAAMDSSCATRWVMGNTTRGVGASAELTYVAAGMRRRLVATVSKGDPGRYVDLDHAGNRGFVTRFELTPDGEGTKVKMTTFLDMPPGILQGYYFTQVQPAWTKCQATTLDNFAAMVKAP